MRKMNPKSLENLRLPDRKGLSRNYQVKVSEKMKKRLDAIPPDTVRAWLQEKLDGHGSDDTVANELIDRVRRGVFDGLPELQELAHRVGIEAAVKIINDSVRVVSQPNSPDLLNRSLALAAAHRLASDWYRTSPLVP